MLQNYMGGEYIINVNCSKDVLNPLDWGWKSSEGGLIPRRMTQGPAPQSLLTLISCKCVKDCRYNCGCKKLGIPCSIFCMHCQGLNCKNARMEVDDDLRTDIDNEIDIFLEKNCNNLNENLLL